MARSAHIAHISRARILTLLLLLALWGSAPRGAEAGSDAKLYWQTLVSGHFRVHFHSGLYLEAVHALEMAERAHATMAPLFDYHPRERCHIVLKDSTDSANGSALTSPYNVINLFAGRPDDNFGGGDEGDWYELLITHEYSHIVQLDTVKGIPDLFNRIFGKVWISGGTLPPWYIEGFATMAESTFTVSGGRARSPFVDMYVRMAILEGYFPTIDELSNSSFLWPRGNVRYYYGGRFLSWLRERFGIEAIAEFNRRYSKRPVPYALNVVAVEAFGKSFVELYREWVAELKTRYAAVREKVMTEGFVAGEPITHTGEVVRLGRWSPDGASIAYFNADAKDPSRLAIMNADGTGSYEPRVTDFGFNAPAWLPESRSMVVMRTEPYRNFYNYTDLYRYDLDKEKVTRLSHGLRARFPHVSADGRRIVFERRHGGSTDLAMMNIDGTGLTTLVEHVLFDSVHTPEFSPDGRSIAFGLRKDYRVDLAVYSLEDGDYRRITSDTARDVDPAWSPDGRFLLFSSDRTGIYNIYAYELETGRLLQITNVLGGAFQPDVSPDGRTLLYQGYGTKGFDLYVMPMRPETWREVPLDDPSLAPLPEGDTLDGLGERAIEMLPSVGRYRPGATLLPRTWEPILGRDAYGMTIGLSTGAEDPAGLHAWNATLQLGLVSLTPSFNASYAYRGLYPTLSVATSRSTSSRSDLRIDGVVQPYVEERWAFSLAASFPFNGPRGNHSVSVRYDGSYIRADGPVDFVLDPGDRKPRFPDEGYLGGVALSWSWSNARSSTFSVGAETGRYLSAAMRVRDRALGSEFRSVEFTAVWEEFIENPLFENHVFAFRLAGGIAAGDFRVRRAFRVGGTPSQDILTALINLSPIGAGFLRGYESGELGGDRYYLGTLEYRFPIWIFDRGILTLPLAFTRLSGLVFFEIGNAFNDPADALRPYPSAGTELVVETRVAYAVPLRFRLGIAQALFQVFDPDARRAPKVYAFLGSLF